MKIKKISLGLFVIVLTILAIMYFSLLREGREASSKALGLSNDTLSYLEKSCVNDNSIDSCILLVDKFTSLRMYDKVVLYGEMCVERGVNSTLVGSYVNALLSSAYLHLGNLEKSKNHLKAAVIIDKDRHVLSSEYLDDLGVNSFTYPM